MIFKHDGKLYSCYYEYGLTECQEYFFEDQEAIEVEKVTKMVEVTEYIPVKR